MKIRLVISTMYACSLFMACAEAPKYEPKPRVATSADQGATQGTKKPADTPKTTTTPDPNSTAAAQPPAATPTPTPTPTPAAPAPAATAGVAATGKTLLTQTCVNANCHSAATNTFDAKTAAALQAAGDLMIAVHTNNKATFFTPPAPGAAANSFAHVLAYFMSIPTPIMGPNLP